MSPASEPAGRVLVLTPSGRDTEMVRERLEAAGIASEAVGDVERLLASMSSAPAGAALVAVEALVGGSAEALRAALEAQEPWSDLPVVLLTQAASANRPPAHPTVALLERANVTILERPLRVQLLVTTLQAAIRARRRQYQTRDLLHELQRAVQLSELFVSILGHDLRTPLGAIKLSAEVIVRQPDAPALRPAGRILASADRMTRMIEQILDFARIRQGRGIPLSARDSDLGEICRSAVEEIEDAIPQRQPILVNGHGSLEGEWDPDRLSQVVSNLVSNAVLHGAQGGSVVVDLDGTAPDSVRIRIHNEGTVPAARLPFLFEAFMGAAGLLPEAKASRSGLGLGLFIAREIARAHGGDITVRCCAADGTTFEVALPRRAVGREG